MQSLPASITLNGANLEVGGHKTLEDALRASGIKPKPGDFVAVDGSVKQERASRFTPPSTAKSLPTWIRS